MKNKSVSKRIVSLIIAVLLALGPVAGTGVFAAEKKAPKYRLGLKRPVIVTGEITLEEYEEIEQRYSVDTRKRSLRSTNDYWKKFSQPYYNFTNGLSEAQIDLYDRMYATLYGMIDGGPDLSEEANEESYLTPIVKSTGPMSVDEAEDVAYLLIYNHPEFYFLNSGLQILEVEGTGERTLRLCVYLDFGTGAARTTMAASLKTKTEEYRGKITGSTPLEKEISIQNLICDNTVYSRAKYDQSCVSVFLENKSVCAGYSEAFNLLCNAEGIPAIAVTSERHEWSQVMLDGRWYAVDVTWDDDEDEPENRFDYFNISDYSLKFGDDYIEEMHTVEEVPWDYVGRPACCYDYPDIENHDWCISGFTWSEDNKTCVATLECMGDETHTLTVNATVTSKVVVEPTTITKGTTEYTATFEDERIDTQTKQVKDIPCIEAEQLEMNAPDQTSVTFDAEEVERIKDEAKPLKVKSKTGDVVFDADAVGSIFKDADTLTLIMENVTAAKADYSSYDLVIELSLIDSKGQHLFTDGAYGKAKITVPYDQEVPEGKTVKVLYITDSGDKTEIDAVYDSGAKTVTFEVEHFSKYAIEQVEAESETGEQEEQAPEVTDKEAAPVLSPQTGDNAPLLLFVCTLLLGGAFLIQKVVS